MDNLTAWTPTLRFHARLFGVMLLVCVLLFAVFYVVAGRLPAPYQLRPAPPQATPWKNIPMEDL